MGALAEPDTETIRRHADEFDTSNRGGNERAIEVGTKMLDHSARINGYAVPQRDELIGSRRRPNNCPDFRNLCAEVEDDGKKEEN